MTQRERELSTERAREKLARLQADRDFLDALNKAVRNYEHNRPRGEEMPQPIREMVDAIHSCVENAEVSLGESNLVEVREGIGITTRWDEGSNSVPWSDPNSDPLADIRKTVDRLRDQGLM